MAAACSRAPAPAKNVLIVLLDTTRADHLSCYGYAKPTTPTIDALAARGVRFDSLYAQSSLTPVCASTILSGATPIRHGVRSLFVVGGETMASDVASLPEMLAASGRRTAAFVSAKPMGVQYGLARGFATYEDDMSRVNAKYGATRAFDAPQRPADDTTDLVLAWLDTYGREPFALMAHYFDAHDPSFTPPRDFLAPRVSFDLPDPLPRAGDVRRIPALAKPENLVELYDAELQFMDAQLERVLAKLEQLGELDRTLVVVLADHGEAFGEHGFWTHGILYQEQLHVPFILAGPGAPEGRVVSARGRQIDVAPTLAELLDLSAPSSRFDGQSLVAAFDRSLPAREVYSEAHHAAEDRLKRDPEMYSLRVKDWKYIHRPTNGAHELYDLAQDPNELHNLYAPDNDVARALAHQLGVLGALGGEVPTLDGLSAEEIARLKELGYL